MLHLGGTVLFTSSSCKRFGLVLFLAQFCSSLPGPLWSLPAAALRVTCRGPWWSSPCSSLPGPLWSSPTGLSLSFTYPKILPLVLNETCIKTQTKYNTKIENIISKATGNKRQATGYHIHLSFYLTLLSTWYRMRALLDLLRL